MSFVHLHLHTEYSLLDGAIRIEEVVKKAKEYGMPAIAITDHGNMFGAIEMYKECKKNDIKPIIGCEFYVAPRSRWDKEGRIDTEPNHLILLAMNNTGYKNLVRLCSIGYTEGFYYKPRIDMEVLEKYNEGLICLSACLAGGLSRKIVNGDILGAREMLEKYISIFGKDRYFLELQDNKLREQVLVNQKLIEFSKEYGVKLVATNDCHYLNKEDYDFHEVLLCIQTRKTLNDEDRFRFKVNEFYFKSPEEMKEAFKAVPEAIENTLKIAQMCNVELEFGHTILPEFKIDENMTHLEYFTKKCYDGIPSRYNESEYEKVKERLDYEISVIDKMGYIDYFLIVADFINYAKSQGIPVGPGRGSGAGSLAAYLIGITDIDPLKFNLIFERFLNPERVSMPDFDVDFCYERRQEVIDYVSEKYGKDHVAQIITFGTMAARAAIRDVARVLDIPYQKADSIAKLIPHNIKIKIDEALEENPDLRKLYNEDLETRRIIDISKKIEGLARQASTHACGVVITKEPVVNYVPLYENEGQISTQYTMTTLEELGLLKMDFLGLRTLTVIDEAKKLIKKIEGIDVDFGTYEDKAVYNMLTQGKTLGVFQMESPGFRKMMMKMEPDSIEDIIVMISLYRPGPMDQIPRYIRNKNNKEHIEYTHPALEEILKPTYGCMVYQEQVMQIFRQLAGYSLGRADIVRRAMGKKKIDVMNKEREIFIEGAKKNNIDEVSANKIFDEMAEFAKYAFNKSHAAAYAVVAYQTAYLKCHYPSEFLAAYMNSFIGNQNKIPVYINESKELGIEVLRPDINDSYAKFAVINGKIRFALNSIKNVGENAIEEIIRERKNNGKYKNFIDFCQRVSGEAVNKKCIESLIKAGCFDEVEKDYNRYDLLSNFETIVDGVNHTRKTNYINQMDFFGQIEEAGDSIKIEKSGRVPSKKDLLEMEKEMLGLYISGHPLDDYKEYIEKNSTVNSLELNSQDSSEEGQIEESIDYDGKNVSMCGIFNRGKMLMTKSGKNMMFAELEDVYGSVELVIFPNVFECYDRLLKDEAVIKVTGKVSIKEDEKTKILVSNIIFIDNDIKDNKSNSNLNSKIENNKKETIQTKKIYVRIPKDKMELEDRVVGYIKDLSSEYPGKIPVYIFYDGTNKMRLLHSSNFLQDNSLVQERLELAFGKENVKIK